MIFYPSRSDVSASRVQRNDQQGASIVTHQAVPAFESFPVTSDAFTGILTTNNIRISMDGRGRWMDNVFIERFWKRVKYEEVYLKAYGSIAEAKQELTKYFDRYNKRRRHQGLGNMTPNEGYCNTLPEMRVAV